MSAAPLDQTEEVTDEVLDQQRDYVMRSVEDRGVRLVRLWFTDILGNLKSFAISPAELENALDDGMTFDGSSIDGFSRIQESDVLAVPDPDTFERAAVGRHQGAPRRASSATSTTSTARRSTATPARCCGATCAPLHDQGLTFYVAPDIEFFYFEPPKPGERPQPLDEGGFFDLTTNDVTGSLRKQTIRTLETMGIPVEYSFHEDAPSQQEIDLRHTDALTMADSVMTFRLIVREVGGVARPARHVHAQAARGRAGLGHAHPPVAVPRRRQRLLRRRDDSYSLSPTSPSRSWPDCCATPPRSRPSPTRRSTATSAWCPASRRRSTCRGRATTAAG